MSGARGEAFLRVGEDEVAVLFTNRALAEVERITGKPVLQLARGVDSLGIADLAALLCVGMETARVERRTGGKKYTLDDAWRIMDEVGFTVVLPVVIDAVATVISWKKDAPKEGGRQEGVQQYAPTSGEGQGRPLAGTGKSS
jgi:hypothetical protein